MKKFLVFYYASAEAMEKMRNSTPEDHKKGMQPWVDWQNQLGDSLLDFGGPIGKAHKVTSE